MIKECAVKIQRKLSLFEEKILTITNPHDMEEVISIVELYVELLKDLFGEPGNPEPYIVLMEADPTKDNIDFYLKALLVLRRKIEGLPFDSTIIDSMLSKISEYCNLKWLSLFEEQGQLSEKGYRQVVVDIHPESLVDTVQVKTWGTKREISNGLRNVILQQLRGEGVGHASVTMRFKADEHGQELIRKYCQNEDGSIRIPYEIKQYGTQAVYEIYWSFWPEGLQTLDNDLKTEHSQVEYQDDVDILSGMPLELRLRYLSQKYIKEQRLPVIGALGEEGTPLFSPDVPNTRKIGLLVDSIDATKVEPDFFRRNYIELKAKQHKLEEEITTLEFLQNNYLVAGEPLSASAISGKENIKPTSNFLLLLKRFLPQLSAQMEGAQILLTKEITAQQSTALEKAVTNLVKQKKQQKAELGASILQAAELIQDNYAEVTLLHAQIDELQQEVDLYRHSLKQAKAVVVALASTIQCGETHCLTEKEEEAFKQFADTFTDHQEAHKKINKILTSRTIELDEAVFLSPIFQVYEQDNRDGIAKETKTLSLKLEKLQTIYATRTEQRREFLEKRVNLIRAAIVRNREEYASFVRFKSQIKPQIDIRQKLAHLTTVLFSLDGILAEFIESPSKSKKKGQAKQQNVSQTKLITYEGLDGPKTTPIKTFEEVLKVKKEIEGTIVVLEKQRETWSKGADSSLTQVKNDKKKAKKEEEFSFSFHNEKGERITKSIKTIADLDFFDTALKDCQVDLHKQKNEALHQTVRFKMTLNTSIEDLEQRIHVGASNDVLLRHFNIEKMLERASEIASSETDFHLANENCSTTSMKLLQAGATEDVAFMFDWHEARDGESVASNMFLTSPQSVYSAAKTVEMAKKGNKEACTLIEGKRKEKPARQYNRLLNQLVKDMTTYNDVHFELPGKKVDNNTSKFSWCFFLKFIPYLFRLYRDIYKTIKVKQEQQRNSLEAQMSRELMALQGQGYYVIDCINPSLAIHRLSEALKAKQTNIPFFNVDTLSRVEHYILTIAAKESQTEEEKNALKNYHDIITERDERLDCMEDAILAGSHVAYALEKRELILDKLSWSLTDKERVKALVDNFIYKYQEIRSRNFIPFLATNFAIHLEQYDSAETKLGKIREHIKKAPNSRSAQAMRECLEQDPILKPRVVNSSIHFCGSLYALPVTPSKGAIDDGATLQQDRLTP